LAGVTLARSEDRVLDLVGTPGTAVDLQIAVMTRMEELARLDARLARENAREARAAAAATTAPANTGTSTLRKSDADDPRRILLVGAKLVLETALHESLRLRGLDVILARGANEALRVFDTRSPEFVLTEARLDRFEGIELIHALRALPGIEDVPVALLDDRARPELRETARRAGAGGYLVRPLDPPRFAAALAEQVRRPRRRRFTRIPLRLHVQAASNGAMGTTSDLGRGGMLVWSEDGIPVADVDRWMVRLPCAGEPVEVEATTVHRRSRPGEGRQGFGLRFRRFAGDGEARLLSWLARLREETRAALD
jgi:two-component system chemotaxis response regulator CheY